MNYTFPLNKTDLLLTSGLAILWQSLDLEEDSKVVKDNQKSLSGLITMIQKESPLVASEFQKMAGSYVTMEARPALSPKSSDMGTIQRTHPATAVVSDSKSKSTRKQLQAIASKWSNFGNKVAAEDIARRATVPQATPVAPMQPHRANSTTSLSSTRSAPVMPMTTASPDRKSTV